MKLEPGTMVGPYRIVSELGRGGMATVYKAYQPALARHVAIKVLPEYFQDEPGFRERFQQEAIAVANLRHRNIPPVYDYGETDGVTYIVSEYIDGGTLHERLGKSLPVEYAIEILTPIAGALDYAHSKGVMHRDVKPSNILLERDGTPVLADFGLAKVMAPGRTGLTRTGMIVGTPEYMSPEQCEGIDLTPASDLYALGVVAYEMLTGRPPFVAPTPLAVILAQVKNTLPPPRAMNPDISESVEKVLLKALAKDPIDRYGSCTKFIRDLVVAAAPAITTPYPPVAAEQKDVAMLAITDPSGVEPDSVPVDIPSGLAGQMPRHSTPEARLNPVRNDRVPSAADLDADPSATPAVSDGSSRPSVSLASNDFGSSGEASLESPLVIAASSTIGEPAAARAEPAHDDETRLYTAEQERSPRSESGDVRIPSSESKEASGRFSLLNLRMRPLSRRTSAVALVALVLLLLSSSAVGLARLNLPPPLFAAGRLGTPSPTASIAPSAAATQTPMPSPSASAPATPSAKPVATSHPTSEPTQSSAPAPPSGLAPTVGAQSPMPRGYYAVVGGSHWPAKAVVTIKLYQGSVVYATVQAVASSDGLGNIGGQVFVPTTAKVGTASVSGCSGSVCAYTTTTIT